MCAAPAPHILAAVADPGAPGIPEASHPAVWFALHPHPQHGTLLHPATRPAMQRRSLPALPPAPASFRNRVAEQHEVLADLGDYGRVWLTGPPGSGRSALLRQFCHTLPADLVAALPDGVAFLDTSAARSAHDVAHVLFAHFYAAPETASATSAVRASPQLAQAALHRLRALVALDHCRLEPRVWQQLATLLHSLPLLAVAATPPAAHLPALRLYGLPLHDALALCAHTLGMSALPPASLPHWEQLCTRLERLPLALVLATRLTGPDGTHLPRVLAALTQAAYDERDVLAQVLTVLLHTLNQSARTTLAALVAVGSPQVSLAALAAISQQPHDMLHRHLERLVAAGLLHLRADTVTLVAPELGPLLVRLLQPTHEQQRALAYAAAQAQAHTSNPMHLAHELDILLAALRQAEAWQSWHELRVLVRAVHPLLLTRGLWDAWGALLPAAERAARALRDAPLLAWVLHERGTHAGMHADFAQAGPMLTQAWTLRLRLGDTAGAQASQRNLAHLSAAQRTLTPLVEPGAPAAATPLSWGHLAVSLLPVVALLLALLLPVSPSATAPAPTPAVPPVSPSPYPSPYPSPTNLSAALPAPTAVPPVPAAPTNIPTNAPQRTVPTNQAAGVPVLAPTLLSTATPLPTATLPPAPSATRPVPTDFSTSTPTNTPVPTDTAPPTPALPTSEPTSTPAPALPTPEPTSTPVPALPTPEPTSTPVPVPPTPEPTSTPAPAPPIIEPTDTPTATDTPAPSATSTPRPSATASSASGGPPAPVPNGPVDDAVMACDSPLTLRWQAVDDPQGIARYEWVLALSATDGPEGPYVDRKFGKQRTSTAVELVVPQDVPCGVWVRWRVRAVTMTEETSPFSPDARFFVREP